LNGRTRNTHARLIDHHEPNPHVRASWTAPDLSEGSLLVYCGDEVLLLVLPLLLVIALLEFDWGEIAQGFEEPPMIEPPHPLERRQFYVHEAAPRAAPVYHLGLV